MNILILEDDPNRVEIFKELLKDYTLYITKYPQEANRWLTEIEFTNIFLDHDLEDIHYLKDFDDSETTGLCTAEFLGKNKELSSGAKIIIHSLNPPGRERMYMALKGRDVSIVPFPILVKYSIVKN